MKTGNLIEVKLWWQIMHLGLAVVLAAIIFMLMMVALPGRQIDVYAATATTMEKSEYRNAMQVNRLSVPKSPITQATTNTFRVYSWWGGAGETEALSVLTEAFHTSHLTVTVVVTDNFDGLNHLFRAGPPGSFQTHVGLEMEGWVNSEQIDPVTQLWEEEGWLDKFHPDIIDLASYQGKLYAVPLNMHRGNVLWCNKNIFATYGLTIPLTFQELLTVANQLQTAGVTVPLALGDKYHWPATHLFETTLLGLLGPDDYGKLWTGKVAFTDDRVKKALETFDGILDYVNADHAALNWSDAAQLMVDGEAGMMVMGDWTDGYFRALGWQPNIDYCWRPVPDTTDSLMLISDAFVMPKNPPNEDYSLDWLRLLGSVDVQDQFNPLKGSAPARLDANSNLYGEYIRWSMDRMVTETIQPSMVHGLAAPNSFTVEASNIISDFITSRNITNTVEALQQAALNAGFWSPISSTWTAVITSDSELVEVSDIVQGLTTTVEIPSDAVTTTTNFTLTVEPAILPPHVVSSANLNYAQYAFTLDATQGNGTYVSTPFSKPVTVTFYYNPVGLEEDRLFIYYWDGNQWLDAATTCDPISEYVRGQHFISTAVCHLTDFGLFEVNEIVYFPIIFKNN